MKASNPYSYVTSGGVANTRVRVTEDSADLQSLYQQFRLPVQLDVAAITYHNGTKKDRSNVKKALNYFVGGTLSPNRRDDNNVQARTLLTLDVEQGPDDAGPPPDPGTVATRLKALKGAGWVYTSLSHTPKSPRYRVVLPLGHPITGDPDAMRAELKASTIAAATKLGIDEWTKPESWNLSQAMYLPAKLKGGTFFQALHTGAAWRTVAAAPTTTKTTPRTGPADIPDERPDPILAAVKSAGLYLGARSGHPGMHYIRCPFHEQHEAENETQTVYYEAHFDGNPRPAVKCMDTAPDNGGTPHLSYGTLVRWLRKEGTTAEGDDKSVLDDYETFDRRSDMSALLDGPAIPQDWAVDQFAPIGRVTVLGGPGGQGKSLALLHVLVYAACGQQWGLFKPTAGPLRSLYISYEDGASQLQNRVQTIARALGAEDNGTYSLLNDMQGQLRKNLRTYAADDDATEWLLLNKPDRFGHPEHTERVDWLIGYLKSRKVRLLALDPVVFTHQLNENDIADMAAYMQTLSRVAKECQCAIVVIHHMSKQGGFGILDDINQNSLRGASSISDNARSVMAGVNMPHLDCPQYGIDPDTRTQYFVAKHVKHNYSAPLPLQVFHNLNGVLTYRPEIKRLGGAAVAEAKEHAKQEQENVKRATQALHVLEYLGSITKGSTATGNQILQETGLQPRTMKTLPDWMESQGWVHIEEGANRSRLFSITKEGRVHLKLVRLDNRK